MGITAESLELRFRLYRLYLLPLLQRLKVESGKHGGGGQAVSSPCKKVKDENIKNGYRGVYQIHPLNRWFESRNH